MIPRARPIYRALANSLDGAREMEKAHPVSDATFAALRAKLDDEGVVELTLFASFYCAVVRVLATLEIVLEPQPPPPLRRLPLP
jgi:hypothetical protein